MRSIDVKRIIQPNNNFNIFRGCTHGCIYCDSRSECYQIGDFENVAVKNNAVSLVEKELAKKKKRVILTTGGMSDPYVHIESELQITRNVLELIAKYHFGISVLTKSDLILRDLDLYELINKHHKAIVQLTITTADDELATRLEPHVASPSRRFEVLSEFANRAITTGIWMTPILPFIEDFEDNIVRIVEKAKMAGVKFILNYGMGTTMRTGSREFFYRQLDLHFPGLKEKYQSTYHDQYICPSPDSKHLLEVFKNTCDRYHIIHDHKAIRELFRSPTTEQLTLF